jgi:hypothetical protein
MGQEARARAVANYSTDTVLSFYEKTFSRVIAGEYIRLGSLRIKLPVEVRYHTFGRALPQMRP